VGLTAGEGHGTPLQYSCLENPTDREAWRATVHGVAKELDETEHACRTNARALSLANLPWNFNWFGTFKFNKYTQALIIVFPFIIIFNHSHESIKYLKIIKKRKYSPVVLQPRNNHSLHLGMSKFLSTIKKQGGNIISPFLRRLEKPHQDGIERNLSFLTCLFFVTVQKTGCLWFYEIIQIVLTLPSPTHVLGHVNHVSCIGRQILNHWATREALQGIVHSSATFQLKPLVTWLLSGMAMQSRGHLCCKPRPGGQPTFHGVTCLWTSMVDSNYFHFFLKHFHWSRVGLQCCVSFCCISKWISYIDTYIHFF